MSAVRLTVLGAGSARCAIPVISSLASYFGERPLEITFWDADEERLDLFDRFARLCFLLMESTHTLKSTTNLVEALQNYDRIILEPGRNCMSKAGQKGTELMFQILELTDRPLVSLMSKPTSLPYDYAHLADWAPAIPESERYVIPLQILRFLNGEEYPYSIIREYERSPLKQWLDDPSSLPLTKGIPTF